MNATQMPQNDFNEFKQVLYMAFKLGKNNWVLALSDGRLKRYVTIPAKQLNTVDKEIGLAIEKFKLPSDVPIARM